MTVTVVVSPLLSLMVRGLVYIVPFLVVVGNSFPSG